MMLLKRIDVWRPHEGGPAIRYNCAQDLKTGKYSVLTKDFVGNNAGDRLAQEGYFSDRVQDFIIDSTENTIWYDTIEEAIRAFDECFAD